MNNIDHVANLFNVADSRTMVFGGTLIDTDMGTGFLDNVMLGPRGSVEKSRAPKRAIMLYPYAEAFINDNAKGEAPNHLLMSSTWINGFLPIHNGMTDVMNGDKAAGKWLNDYGIATTDQIINTRPANKMTTLFSCFKWYKTTERLIDDKKLIDDEEFSGLLKYGMVHHQWKKNPLSIRYIVRKKGSVDVPDYIYLIGGSDELLEDSLDGFHKELVKPYKKRAIPTPLSGMNAKIWEDSVMAHETENRKKINVSEFMTPYLPLMKMARQMSGIIYIRNYLEYASRYLGVTEIIDMKGVTGDNKIKPKKVSISEVKEIYEDTYQYCKNLMYSFGDIATMEIDPLSK